MMLVTCPVDEDAWSVVSVKDRSEAVILVAWRSWAVSCYMMCANKRHDDESC